MIASGREDGRDRDDICLRASKPPRRQPCLEPADKAQHGKHRQAGGGVHVEFQLIAENDAGEFASALGVAPLSFLQSNRGGLCH